MSTDWNVHCLDCDDTHRFSDANHQIELMATLIRHAKAIGALAPLFEEPRASGGMITLQTSWGGVCPAWFAKHAEHRLIPRNEYGGYDDSCWEYFACGGCGHQQACHLPKGHDGPHAEKRP